jgi:hypothetical protein
MVTDLVNGEVSVNTKDTIDTSAIFRDTIEDDSMILVTLDIASNRSIIAIYFPKEYLW